MMHKNVKPSSKTNMEEIKKSVKLSTQTYERAEFNTRYEDRCETEYEDKCESKHKATAAKELITKCEDTNKYLMKGKTNPPNKERT